MLQKHAFFILLASFLGVFSLFSQTLENINLESLTINDGLSQGMIYDIHQDKLGFMWFATKDGLNKYDGYEFTRYQHSPKSKDGLSNPEVMQIEEDNRGYFWLFLGNGDINVFITLSQIVRGGHDGHLGVSHTGRNSDFSAADKKRKPRV